MPSPPPFLVLDTPRHLPILCGTIESTNPPSQSAPDPTPATSGVLGGFAGIGPKQVLLVFAATLAFYIITYSWIEHRRQVKGPWLVEFIATENSTPTLRVYQPFLNITNLTLRFPGESLPANFNPALIHVVRFDKPQVPVPFGEVIYEDLTFLPGVVTFNLFGHEIELMPRVLTINKQEIPWNSREVIDLDPAAKPATPPRPPKG